MWIGADEFLPILCTCKEWYDLGTSNKIWKLFYQHRFVRLNPFSDLPVDYQGRFIQAFEERLFDPHIGDKVEVAWRGKFRLEASEVYHGLAWWVAEVVDKHSSQQKYKIKYPGWDDRWNEWVSRSRLRWKVETNNVVQIRVGDPVEVWCVGMTVPGAWLESRVIQVSQQSDGSGTASYCVDGVLTTGDLWVDRDRLRLVKFENPNTSFSAQNTGASGGSTGGSGSGGGTPDSGRRSNSNASDNPVPSMRSMSLLNRLSPTPSLRSSFGLFVSSRSSSYSSPLTPVTPRTAALSPASAVGAVPLHMTHHSHTSEETAAAGTGAGSRRVRGISFPTTPFQRHSLTQQHQQHHHQQEQQHVNFHIPQSARMQRSETITSNSNNSNRQSLRDDLCIIM